MLTEVKRKKIVLILEIRKHMFLDMKKAFYAGSHEIEGTLMRMKINPD